MKIVKIVESYSVSEQIALSDLPILKAQGFTTIICNRPDAEVDSDLHAENFAKHASALGLTYVHNPFSGGQLSATHLTDQAAAIADATGPVLAYCSAGYRSTVLWALVQAGKLPVDDIVHTAAQAGYSVENLRPMIEHLAAQ